MGVTKALFKLQDIPANGALAIELPSGRASGADSLARAQMPFARESIVALRQGDGVFAYRNVCPHAGRRLDWAPGKFLIEDDLLICAAHGATFSIATGECIAGPCRGESLQRVAVAIEGDEVSIGGAAV